MLPKNRQLKKLGEYVEFQNGYAFKSDEYSTKGFFVMRIKNVQDGYISLDDPQYISRGREKEFEKFILNENDILMSLTGNIGRVGLVQKNHLPALLNQRVARLKIDPRYIVAEYLFYFLRRSEFQKILMERASGAAQKNISVKDIAQIQIPLPPLEEQKKIVSYLDELNASITKLKSEYQSQLAMLDEMRNSSLDLAFGGSRERERESIQLK